MLVCSNAATVGASIYFKYFADLRLNDPGMHTTLALVFMRERFADLDVRMP